MRRLSIFVSLLLLGANFLYAQTPTQMPKQLAPLPSVAGGKARGGAFVAATIEEYKGTEVRHMIYLPANYNPKKSYPLVVELTGNKWPYGSGEVEEAHFGYSATLGRDFIWVVLPYIAKGGKGNQVTWWGDEKLTVEYAKKVVPYIIKEYNGDSDNVLLCGFSRGSIGVSYLGLYDDEIASLWSGFFTHDHFDGLQEWRGTSWGSPLDKFREKAKERLLRAKGKRWFLSCAHSSQKYKELLTSLEVIDKIHFTFVSVPMGSYFKPMPNDIIRHSHNDVWPLYDTPSGTELREWIYKSVGKKWRK